MLSMLAKIQSCAVIGLEGALVEVEVDLSNGLAAFTIVGLPDAAVNESRERVRAAIKNSGCLFPYKRITVNLAPADLRKEGPAYDLPIAIGILLASEQIYPDEQIEEYLFLGELSLDGSVRHTNGILPMVALARDKQVKAVFVPAVDAMEASLLENVTIYPVETLGHLVAHLNHERHIEPYIPDPHILDNTEQTEFGQNVLEVLRQPLEDKVVTISRAQGTITYPANFMLIAAMNPCPCGYYGDPVKECSCTSMAIARYQKRISGPLLDRIDIHVEVPRVDYEKLADKRQVENSETIRKRVQAARERQFHRFEGTRLTCNAEMGPNEVRDFCQTDTSGEKLLKAATQQLHLSARAYHRVLKLARTIADLASNEMIMANHIAEAIQYRPRVGA